MNNLQELHYFQDIKALLYNLSPELSTAIVDRSRQGRYSKVIDEQPVQLCKFSLA